MPMRSGFWLRWWEAAALITIDAAAAVFSDCYAHTRSLTSPSETIAVDGMLVVRDIPGYRRTPRNEEIVMPAETEAAHIIDQLHSYQPVTSDAVCVLRNPAYKSQMVVSAMKANGFRFLRTEPLMSRETSSPISTQTAHQIQRATNAAQAELVRKLSRQRLLTPGDLEGTHPSIRLYFCEYQGKAIAYTRSVRHKSSAAYVGGMYTAPAFRRQGIGTALLAHMLADEHNAGTHVSVLLASKAGEALYRSVGYSTIGKLLMFSPVK